MNKKTIERIAVLALGAFLVGYFAYQVAYGTNESSYQYGYKIGRQGYDCSNFDADCDNGLSSCTIGPQYLVIPYKLGSEKYYVTNQTACDDGFVNGWKQWITSADLEYMTLIMIYALVRLAWEKNVLIIGLIKDTAAAELTKTIVPILQNAHKINIAGTGTGEGRLPNFNTDKQLLQISSVINGQFVKTPWRTFEFDSCFRTISPISHQNNNTKNDIFLGSCRHYCL